MSSTKTTILTELQAAPTRYTVVPEQSYWKCDIGRDINWNQILLRSSSDDNIIYHYGKLPECPMGVRPKDSQAIEDDYKREVKEFERAYKVCVDSESPPLARVQLDDKPAVDTPYSEEIQLVSTPDSNSSPPEEAQSEHTPDTDSRSKLMTSRWSLLHTRKAIQESFEPNFASLARATYGFVRNQLGLYAGILQQFDVLDIALPDNTCSVVEVANLPTKYSDRNRETGPPKWVGAAVQPAKDTRHDGLPAFPIKYFGWPFVIDDPTEWKKKLDHRRKEDLDPRWPPVFAES